MEKLDKTSFEADPVLFADKAKGIAINPDINRILIFTRDRGRWTLSETLKVSDIRNIISVDASANEVELFGNFGVGERVGVQIRNSMERKKARNSSGILVELASISTPTVFINVPDTEKRQRLGEAIRQCVEGRPFSGQVSSNKFEIFESFPTQKMIEERAERKKIGRSNLVYLILFATFVGLAYMVVLYFQNIEDQRYASATSSLRMYIRTLQESPELLSQSEDEYCELLRSGYATLIDRNGESITHVTNSLIDVPSSDSRFIPTVWDGLAISLDQNNNEFTVARNSHYYINGLPTEFSAPLPAPEGLDVFTALIEPSC